MTPHPTFGYDKFRPDPSELEAGKPLDAVTISNLPKVSEIYTEAAERYNANSQFHPDAAQRMGFIAGSTTASALAIITELMIEWAEIIGEDADKFRATTQAAGIRCKAVLDIFDALTDRGKIPFKDPRTAEAFITLCKLTLTPIFDDLL